MTAHTYRSSKPTEELGSGACPTGTVATHEEWRRVPVSPYRAYEVSSLGRVRRGTKVLSLVPDSSGYLTIKLCYAGIPKRFKVNRLICETFNGPPPFVAADAAHNDGVKVNNTPGNLAWKTRKANIADKKRHGTHQAGDRHGGAKLSVAEVSAIRERAEAGETFRGIANDFPVSDEQVRRIAHGVCWSSNHE